MGSCSSLLCFVLSFFFSPVSSSPSTDTSTSTTTAAAAISTTTIFLSHFHQNPSPDPYQNLFNLASISRTRAQHLKFPQSTPLSLFPHSYGGYSVSLNFGTPPQSIQFIMDTGSDFVWFPCTHRYICRDCPSSSSSSSSSAAAAVRSFIPKQSSSSRILGCMNPKCGLIHNDSDVQSRCQDCEPNPRNCSQICPPYLIVYGSGSTGGIPLVEKLDLPGKQVDGFVVGCSLFSSRQPAGIVGFGRGPASLPSQMGLTKFSYCLLSHKFDDTNKTSTMVLDSGTSSGDRKTEKLSYTKFLKNPVVAGKHAFEVYYYVGLRKVTVGGRKVMIPWRFLLPGTDGNGGTIVDSGTTFTYMVSTVHELVVNEFVKQVEYVRAENVELQTGLQPCFNVAGGGRKTTELRLPEMKFYFKGGSEMALPLANYFSIVGGLEVVCLTMVTDKNETGTRPMSFGGPSIILGNFQLQNFFTEFDLKNKRFGFKQQSCK